MTTDTLKTYSIHPEAASRYVPRYACLPRGGIKTYTELGNEAIHCTSGRLWVTFEGDSKDHILEAGEHCLVPNHGRVIISGPGCLRISSSIDGLSLAAAS